MNCKKCGGDMKVGKALQQTYTGSPDDLGGDVVTMSAGGSGVLVECLKCVACGWSISGSDTPICDANFHTTERDDDVVPLCVARALERNLSAEKEDNAKHFQENNRRFQQLERALAIEVELRCKAEDKLGEFTNAQNSDYWKFKHYGSPE